MQIRRIRLHPLSVPMARPIRMAGETLTHAHTLLVAVHDEDDQVGWGEAGAAPLMTGETLPRLLAGAEHLASRLVGQSIDRIDEIDARFDRVLYGNASARAALETALADLLARRAGLPLHRLLAADTRPPGAGRLEMLHMLASGDLDAELDEARRVRATGVRQWKIKVGAGPIERDVQRVQALCAALAGDVVSADANQALDLPGAQALARAGRAAGLAFLEQPFPAGELDAMAALHAETGLPLCADESIHDRRDIAAHAQARAAQGVSLKLIKLGGTRALVQAGRDAQARGLRLNLACKVAETTVSAAATAHAGLALGDVRWGFSMSNRYLAEDVCAHPLKAMDGAVQAHQLAAPGLGVAPDADRLAAFAVSGLHAREWSAAR